MCYVYVCILAALFYNELEESLDALAACSCIADNDSKIVDDNSDNGGNDDYDDCSNIAGSHLVYEHELRAYKHRQTYYHHHWLCLPFIGLSA